jgi:hypothetical protein
METVSMSASPRVELTPRQRVDRFLEDIGLDGLAVRPERVVQLA